MIIILQIIFLVNNNNQSIRLVRKDAHPSSNSSLYTYISTPVYISLCRKFLPIVLFFPLFSLFFLSSMYLLLFCFCFVDEQHVCVKTFILHSNHSFISFNYFSLSVFFSSSHSFRIRFTSSQTNVIYC